MCSAEVTRGIVPQAESLEADKRQTAGMSLAVSNAWPFGPEEGEVRQLLSDHGLELRSHYTATDMERMYFITPDGRT